MQALNTKCMYCTCRVLDCFALLAVYPNTLCICSFIRTGGGYAPLEYDTALMTTPAPEDAADEAGAAQLPTGHRHTIKPGQFDTHLTLFVSWLVKAKFCRRLLTLTSLS